jgi:hypothetical protein
MSVPQIIHRVFVSSTFEDLREERSEVQKALLKINCFPVGMEIFPSSEDETWEFIKRQITESDYYIVVIAGRYGSTAPDGISWTEMEYNYAREMKIPSIAFVHSDPGKIPMERSETDSDRRQRLIDFTQKAMLHPVAKFNSAHELAKEVIAGIVSLRDRYPKPGFVRVNETADLKKYAELLEANALLRTQLEQSKETQPFEGADISVELNFTHPTMGRRNAKKTLRDVFITLADQLLLGNIKNERLKRPFAKFAESKEFTLNDKTLNKVIKQFAAYGLVESYVSAGDHQFWKLTEKGRQQYVLLSQGH